jgi:hypothetical protein
LYCITCLVIYYRNITVIFYSAARNTGFIAIIYSDRVHFCAAFTIHSLFFLIVTFILSI